jgi:TolB-like protein/Tfp pilus assembly protein PilF
VSGKSEALISLAESVADGTPVDWEAIATHATDDDRPVIEQLRILAGVVGLHRTLPPDAIDAGDRPPLLPKKPPAIPVIGRWGGLALLERLGGGSYGEVYRAWDRQLERDVALKLVRGDASPDDPRTSRIALEGRLIARVRHPNVITVHGVAVNQGRVGLWMELVHGATLEQLLQERGPFGAREAALIGVDLCRALAALHGAGLIHRDIKAQNVMRESGGRIVLMDLGTGRETREPGTRASADMAGTPLYLAPEIFEGGPASARTDLYSLGVLLYRLVTASFPVRAATIDELRAAHAGGARVRLRDGRPDLPTAFVRVVDRATAADPALRYATAGELESDLLQSLDDRAAATVPPPEARREHGPWRAALLAASVIGAVGLGLLLWRAGGGRTAESPGAPMRSIAVLPLVNVSGDPAQQYLADGLTDELISTLGRVDGLHVISRTSVMRFKGATAPLPEIAKTLVVGTVLEGSLLVVPGGGGPAASRRVRINARLVRAGTDTQLWTRTFERDMTDVLLLQSEVAAAVAESVGMELLQGEGGAPGQAASQPPQTPDAIDLYLRGRYQWNLRTREGFSRAAQYFKEALDRDPRFARAYAGLADAYNLQGIYGMISRADADTLARQAATQALKIDPSLAEAHASLGHIHSQRFEWDAAEASLRRAMELRPSYATAHHWYSAFLSQRGRLVEAMAAIDRAMALDPLSASVNAEKGVALMLVRRYDEAIVQVERAIRLDPAFARPHMVLAEALAHAGQYDRALAETDRAAKLGGEGVELTADIGYIHAVAGRRGQAVAIAKQLAAQYGSRLDGAAAGAATVYAGLRDVEQTIQWLERAWERRDAAIPDLKSDPRFDSVRMDPRFAALLKRAGLEQ